MGSSRGARDLTEDHDSTLETSTPIPNLRVDRFSATYPPFNFIPDFLIIPIAFYVVVAAAGLNLDQLRKEGWLFESAQGTGGLEDKWYGFYSYYGVYARQLC